MYDFLSLYINFKMKILNILYSVFVWTLILFITIWFASTYIIVWLFTFLFDKNLVVINTYATIWGSSFTFITPGWNVKVIGRENLKKSKSKIIVVNHQSLEDIIVVYRLGIPFRWVSKAEVFKIPIYGWLMHLKGDIKLRRMSKSSIKRMLSDTEVVLNKNCTVTIFPEGTRSKAGKMSNFKEGAFRLAQKTKNPVIPVVIYGTDQPIIHSKFLFRGKHQVTMKILNEIPYPEFKELGINDFSRMVKSIMEKEFKKLKQESNES